ncbi:MAG: CUB domain-containing protein [Lentimonas sp.]
MYCSGTQVISQPGTISDGSGSENYSPESNCKWHIKAPAGHVIRFKFLEFDTEKLVDKLYFFNGSKTNTKIMAICTGQEPLEELVTWSNEVPVWFVTDSLNQGAGWEMLFEFIPEIK